MIFLSTVYRKARAMSEELDRRQVKATENPDTVPKIQTQAYAQMRQKFTTDHKDVVLLERAYIARLRSSRRSAFL
eukprot:1385377-Amphidinium_carterae.1